MAVMGVPMLLGPIFGPILGGWLVDDFSWHWIFFINVPVGIVALVMTVKILPRDVSAPNERLDWLGLVLLSPSLAAIIYGLAKSNEAGGFDAPEVLIPVIAGVIVLGVFIWHALRTSDPLIDLRLYANKVFSASSATLVLMIIAVFGGLLLVPLYFQAVRGEDALSTGLLLAPQGFGSMIMMPIAGRLVDRTGVGRIVPAGLVVVGLSFLGLTQLEADTSYWLIGALLFLQGVGMGATMMPTFSGAMQTLRRRDISRASTTLNIQQQVGASIGTAVLSVLLASAITSRLSGLGAAGGGGEGGIGAASGLPPEARAQIAGPMAEAFGQTFWVALALVGVAFVVAVVLLPKEKPEPVHDPEDDASEEAPVLMHA
jgi:EmrB/QacA subfamily drug resistance transporter